MTTEPIQADPLDGLRKAVVGHETLSKLEAMTKLYEMQRIAKNSAFSSTPEVIIRLRGLRIEEMGPNDCVIELAKLVEMLQPHTAPAPSPRTNDGLHTQVVDVPMGQTDPADYDFLVRSETVERIKIAVTRHTHSWTGEVFGPTILYEGHQFHVEDARAMIAVLTTALDEIERRAQPAAPVSAPQATNETDPVDMAAWQASEARKPIDDMDWSPESHNDQIKRRIEQIKRNVPFTIDDQNLIAALQDDLIDAPAQPAPAPAPDAVRLSKPMKRQMLTAFALTHNQRCVVVALHGESEPVFFGKIARLAGLTTKKTSITLTSLVKRNIAEKTSNSQWKLTDKGNEVYAVLTAAKR